VYWQKTVYNRCMARNADFGQSLDSREAHHIARSVPSGHGADSTTERVTPSFQNCKLSELRKEIKRGCSMHPMRENTTAAKLAKCLGVNIKTV